MATRSKTFYGHTYDETCLLHAASNTFTRRASEVAIDPPKISAQFFYCSALPIDDPLSPVPSPSSTSSRVPPRPFNVHDNLALDQAWLELQQAGHSQDELKDRDFENESSAARGCPSQPEYVSDIVGDTIKGANIEGKIAKKTRFERPNRERNQDLTLSDDPDHVPFDDTMPVSAGEIGNDEFEAGMVKQKSRSPFRCKEKNEMARQEDEIERDNDIQSPRSSRRLSRQLSKVGIDANDDKTIPGSSPSERNTTGTPFLRIASQPQQNNPKPSSTGSELDPLQFDGAKAGAGSSMPRISSPLRSTFQSTQSKGFGDGDDSLHHEPEKSDHIPKVHTVVGFQRLHVVEMPSLKMGPIYWDPVHDVSSVVRGTWFYKDTMWPVESDLANQIEDGYEYIKPWTPTYIDELNSCIEIGPEAEIKVCHRIWPADEPIAGRSRSTSAKGKENLLKVATTQALADKREDQRKNASSTVRTAENMAAGVLQGFETMGRLFAKSSIIYANATDAQILKPSQLPSAATGRRPLANIRKGKAIGIPVVRGFDTKAWEKINPPTKSVAAARLARETAFLVKQEGNITANKKVCTACAVGEEKPKPTDLILVIHGIGQKLSERVESFHFTHLVNSFRRQLNMELASDDVKAFLRQDMGAVMVLPINWRSSLKLEDVGPEPALNGSHNDPLDNQYTLKDITAESIPAVRNLISDVMLDIPYYLSHHKPKMIEAVIREANRVYRLWCSNNPGFQGQGRVHLIAHSLGSVMALDILSKQPTRLPEDLSLKTDEIRTDILEFDTKNIFFCGSPSGFFLLLHHAPLVPRKNRNKPGTEGEDTNTGVTGEIGTYGCLAVDNLYNVLHYNDPVAYRLNACVDVDYAASLQPASVPSANASWGQYFGSFIRGKAVPPTKVKPDSDFPQRPTTARLPTTVELETHNFTKEELAEKRMYLLNDNGQIDYILHSGGGPLEIQYLNMLSAHSSYWGLRDFVRFLVVEIGRTPGRSHTINRIRAAKKPFGKKVVVLF